MSVCVCTASPVAPAVLGWGGVALGILCLVFALRACRRKRLVHKLDVVLDTSGLTVQMDCAEMGRVKGS